MSDYELIMIILEVMRLLLLPLVHLWLLFVLEKTNSPSLS